MALDWYSIGRVMPAYGRFVFICQIGLVMIISLVSAADKSGIFEDSNKSSDGASKLDPRVYLARGSFKMGSSKMDHFKSGEYPLKHIQVKPFIIDRYPVTNGDFMTFKNDKRSYLTDAEIRGHSWVFIRHKAHRAKVNKAIAHPDGPFWVAVKNASWSQPFGPGSNLEGKKSDPVVHVSYHDAYAFCQWAKKRVVSEYEWEYAARGGAEGNKFPWGNQSDLSRSNLWQGRFPDYDLAKDGYEGISPVDAFGPQNDFGVYDMLGNVWEWTSTVFRVPRVVHDPNNPEYTARGASFIDTYDGRANDEARVSARRGFSPEYSSQNLGFRCAQPWNPDATTPKPSTRPRKPVRHRYEDTWEYKLKNTLGNIVGTFHRAEEL